MVGDHTGRNFCARDGLGLNVKRKLKIALLAAALSVLMTTVAVAKDAIGTSGPDTVYGTDGPDQLYGEGGDDRLFAAGGDDYVEGGPGIDLIHGGAGTDLLLGGTSGDTILGEGGPDSAYAGQGNDAVSGGGGADVLLGQSGDDRLNGAAGRDRLYGGAGADRLAGGAGGDYLSASAQSLVDGGDQDDRIYLHDQGGDVPRLAAPSGYSVLGGRGNDTIDARDGRPSTIDCGAGFDRVLADHADRAVHCERRSERPR